VQLLSISKLTRIIGDKTLFKELDFGISLGEKVAIVGVNGTGKSTLLRIILGREEADAGEIIRSRSLKISALEQNPVFDPKETVREHLFGGGGALVTLIRKYEEICELLSNGDSKVEEEYSRLSQEMDRMEAWEYEAQITSILKELGVEDLNRTMSMLSGGMLKKVELATALIDESNLLILDEPTNHLDVKSIMWLEEFLADSKKAVILITHDRYFLDRVVDRILEIDSGKHFTYEGNYSYFLEKKIEREDSLRKQEEKTQQFLKQEIKWLRRQPKARSTKQKARIDRAEGLQNREVFEIEKELELSVAAKRQGKTILEIKNLSKSFKDTVILKDFTYYFKPKERLGVVGPNGIGKSTLLNMFAGSLKPDSGTINPGVNTVIGYFDQISRELPLDMNVLDYIKKYAGEYIINSDGEKVTASKLLERFLFDGKSQYSLIAKLSGGEKRRLYLVQILMKGPNFLILDEPTNDLDIKTLSILEDFLLSFPGSIVTVSHDRYFLDRIAETLLSFTGDGIIESYVGTYSAYLEKFPPGKPIKKEVIVGEPITIVPQSPTIKKSTKSIKELLSLEKEIEKLEAIKTDLENEISTNAINYKKVEELTKQLTALQVMLDDTYKKWEKLSE
jgi:ATP-binding cassette subfamily F protein uup